MIQLQRRFSIGIRPLGISLGKRHTELGRHRAHLPFVPRFLSSKDSGDWVSHLLAKYRSAKMRPLYPGDLVFQQGNWWPFNTAVMALMLWPLLAANQPLLAHTDRVFNPHQHFLGISQRELVFINQSGPSLSGEGLPTNGYQKQTLERVLLFANAGLPSSRLLEKALSASIFPATGEPQPGARQRRTFLALSSGRSMDTQPAANFHQPMAIERNRLARVFLGEAGLPAQGVTSGKQLLPLTPIAEAKIYPALGNQAHVHRAEFWLAQQEKARGVGAPHQPRRWLATAAVWNSSRRPTGLFSLLSGKKRVHWPTKSNLLVRSLLNGSQQLVTKTGGTKASSHTYMMAAMSRGPVLAHTHVENGKYRLGPAGESPGGQKPFLTYLPWPAPGTEFASIEAKGRAILAGYSHGPGNRQVFRPNVVDRSQAQNNTSSPYLHRIHPVMALRHQNPMLHLAFKYGNPRQLSAIKLPKPDVSRQCLTENDFFFRGQGIGWDWPIDSHGGGDIGESGKFPRASDSLKGLRTACQIMPLGLAGSGILWRQKQALSIQRSSEWNPAMLGRWHLKPGVGRASFIPPDLKQNTHGTIKRFTPKRVSIGQLPSNKLGAILLLPVLERSPDCIPQTLVPWRLSLPEMCIPQKMAVQEGHAVHFKAVRHLPDAGNGGHQAGLEPIPNKKSGRRLVQFGAQSKPPGFLKSSIGRSLVRNHKRGLFDGFFHQVHLGQNIRFSQKTEAISLTMPFVRPQISIRLAGFGGAFIPAHFAPHSGPSQSLFQVLKTSTQKWPRRGHFGMLFRQGQPLETNIEAAQARYINGQKGMVKARSQGRQPNTRNSLATLHRYGEKKVPGPHHATSKISWENMLGPKSETNGPGNVFNLNIHPNFGFLISLISSKRGSGPQGLATGKEVKKLPGPVSSGAKTFNRVSIGMPLMNGVSSRRFGAGKTSRLYGHQGVGGSLQWHHVFSDLPVKAISRQDWVSQPPILPDPPLFNTVASRPWAAAGHKTQMKAAHFGWAPFFPTSDRELRPASSHSLLRESGKIFHENACLPIIQPLSHLAGAFGWLSDVAQNISARLVARRTYCSVPQFLTAEGPVLESRYPMLGWKAVHLAGGRMRGPVLLGIKEKVPYRCFINGGVPRKGFAVFHDAGRLGTRLRSSIQYLLKVPPQKLVNPLAGNPLPANPFPLAKPRYRVWRYAPVLYLITSWNKQLAQSIQGASRASTKRENILANPKKSDYEGHHPRFIWHGEKAGSSWVLPQPQRVLLGWLTEPPFHPAQRHSRLSWHDSGWPIKAGFGSELNAEIRDFHSRIAALGPNMLAPGGMRGISWLLAGPRRCNPSPLGLNFYAKKRVAGPQSSYPERLRLEPIPTAWHKQSAALLSINTHHLLAGHHLGLPGQLETRARISHQNPAKRSKLPAIAAFARPEVFTILFGTPAPFLGRKPCTPSEFGLPATNSDERCGRTILKEFPVKLGNCSPQSKLLKSSVLWRFRNAGQPLGKNPGPILFSKREKPYRFALNRGEWARATQFQEFWLKWAALCFQNGPPLSAQLQQATKGRWSLSRRGSGGAPAWSTEKNAYHLALRKKTKGFKSLGLRKVATAGGLTKRLLQSPGKRIAKTNPRVYSQLAFFHPPGGIILEKRGGLSLSYLIEREGKGILSNYGSRPWPDLTILFKPIKPKHHCWRGYDKTGKKRAFKGANPGTATRETSAMSPSVIDTAKDDLRTGSAIAPIQHLSWPTANAVRPFSYKARPKRLMSASHFSKTLQAGSLLSHRVKNGQIMGAKPGLMPETLLPPALEPRFSVGQASATQESSPDRVSASSPPVYCPPPMVRRQQPVPPAPRPEPAIDQKTLRNLIKEEISRQTQPKTAAPPLEGMALQALCEQVYRHMNRCQTRHRERMGN